MRFKQHFFAAIAVLSSSLAQAALIYNANTGAGGTDPDGFAGSGVYSFASGGSWNGDGTVQALDTTVASGSNPIVVGFTQGEVHFTDVTPPVAGTFTDPNFNIRHLISLGGGGTGDLDMSIDAQGIRRVELTLGSDVSSISFDTFTSTPVHARSINTVSSNFHPWIASARYIDRGTNPVNADVSMTLEGLQTVPGFGIPAQAGVVGTNPQIFGLQTGSAHTYNQVGDTFTYQRINLGTGTSNPLGFRHVQLDIQPGITSNGPYRSSATLTDAANQFLPAGLNDGLISKGEQLYADTHRITITPNGGTTFGTGAQFYFTFDAFQGEDSFESIAIPEPSRATLLLLASTLLFWRRRKGR